MCCCEIILPVSHCSSVGTKHLMKLFPHNAGGMLCDASRESSRIDANRFLQFLFYSSLYAARKKKRKREERKNEKKKEWICVRMYMSEYIRTSLRRAKALAIRWRCLYWHNKIALCDTLLFIQDHLSRKRSYRTDRSIYVLMYVSWSLNVECAIKRSRDHLIRGIKVDCILYSLKILYVIENCYVCALDYNGERMLRG